MRKFLLPALTLSLLAVAAPSFAQTGGGGISGSGGEQPYGGNTSRDEVEDQLLKPKLGKQAAPDEYALGIQALQQKQYSDAIQHLEVAVQKKPDDANALFYAGYAHHMSGQKLAGAARDGEYASALSEYKRAVAADNSLKAAHQYLGVLYLQTHDLDSAREQQKALESLCPSDCEELDKLRTAVVSYVPAASGGPGTKR